MTLFWSTEQWNNRLTFSNVSMFRDIPSMDYYRKGRIVRYIGNSFRLGDRERNCHLNKIFKENILEILENTIQ